MANPLIDRRHVLLFDLDGTIFDTKQLKIDISRDLKTYTDDIQILWETEKKLRNQRYHLVETMKQFCEKIGRDDIQHTIQEIFLHRQFEQYVFPEVKSAINQCREKAVTAIFTQGDESYQQVKIYQSQLASVFDFLYIYHNKMAHLPNILRFFEWKEVWLIDNHISILQHAKEHFPKIKTVWVNREQLPNDTGFNPDVSLETLSSFYQYLI